MRRADDTRDATSSNLAGRAPRWRRRPGPQLGSAVWLNRLPCWIFFSARRPPNKVSSVWGRRLPEAASTPRASSHLPRECSPPIPPRPSAAAPTAAPAFSACGPGVAAGPAGLGARQMQEAEAAPVPTPREASWPQAADCVAQGDSFLSVLSAARASLLPSGQRLTRGEW